LGARVEGLARRLGYWPVLLKLAAARIALAVSRNAKPEQAIAAVEEDYEEMGVTAFDAAIAKSRDEAVEKSIRASLRFVEDESGAISRAFEALAVAPDDMPIPLEVLAGLWGCGSGQARRIAESLADVALLDLDFGQGAVPPTFSCTTSSSITCASERPICQGFTAAPGEMGQSPATALRVRMAMVRLALSRRPGARAAPR